MTSDLRFYIKRPKGRHRSFALVAFTWLPTRQKAYQPLAPQLASKVSAVNSQFKSGAIGEHEAVSLLKNVIARAMNRAGHFVHDSQLSEPNQKTFDRFWHDEYSMRFLKDEKAMRYKLLKALRLIEPLAVQTASCQELSDQLRANSKSTDELRYAVDRLNQILAHLKRGFRLRKPKPTFRTVKHLTLPELRSVLPFIADPGSRALAVTLFASGCRLSEALALTPFDLGHGSINVTKQLTRKGLELPKREKVGWAGLIPIDEHALKSWLHLPDKERYRERFAKDLRRACHAAFPTDSTKWVSPHDLRHSYAIHCLSLGVSIDEVSLSLRNTVPVCQRYYIGYSHTAGSLKNMVSVLQSHGTPTGVEMKGDFQ